MNLATVKTIDPHVQLRRLYTSLLEDQHRFDEFRQLLSTYPSSEGEEDEGDEARTVRAQLNARISDWVCGPFEGLTASQVMVWQSIVVHQRFNIPRPEEKEANTA